MKNKCWGGEKCLTVGLDIGQDVQARLLLGSSAQTDGKANRI